MASIIEAFDSTIKEAFAGLKVLIWAVPVCFAVSAWQSSMGSIVGIVTAVLFVGYLTTICNNIIIKTDRILPGINVFQYGLVGLIAVLIMIPYGIVAYFVWNLVNNISIPDPVWGLTVKVLGAFLALSFILSAFVLYIRRLNPIEAYNLRKYFIGFGEVFMSFSYLIVKLVLWSLVIIGFLVYLFSLFVGFENVLWTYLMCAVGVFYCILGANYMAQTSEEIFTFLEKKENEQKQQKAIDKMTEE